MAASTLSKAALNHARSHKPWERAENDSHNDIETLQFNFDDAGTLTASSVGNDRSASVSEVEPTSPAHEMTRDSLGHTWRDSEVKPSSPVHEITHAAAGHSGAPAGTDRAVEQQ